jgi:hypothetical protein
VLAEVLLRRAMLRERTPIGELGRAGGLPGLAVRAGQREGTKGGGDLVLAVQALLARALSRERSRLR